jgi:lysozyme family protein
MTASNFDGALQRVLAHEGGYVDHPKDPGGATNLGITLATLARWRGRPVTKAEVAALTRAEAAAIYRAFYWDAVRADALPGGLDYAVFDLAVNSGPDRAARLLQRALGVAQDGRIGPHTLAAAAADPAAAIRALQRERRAFLERLPTWPVFGRGWSRRLDEVGRDALALAGPPQPKEPSMMDSKAILSSRTVWSNALGLVFLGLGLVGVDTGSVDLDRTAEALSQIMAAGSFVASTVFRIAATKQLNG